ncbi:hypothetical protein OG936_33095 [Streptomyces sp. NBC_00846]|uniref:hypothetical protein n=1 Tax=Streptomyces sp. NBC_00846 TaxID=2975849 RepID=UPI003868DD15|nr:hypothetical protein OG936_33095 [Streptomyces sp. NBC_00846]
MRAIGVAPVALLGVAVLALTSPAATPWAETSGGASSATGYTVTPSVIMPGSQVALAARGCSTTATTATAGSGVVDTVTSQTRHRKAGGNLPASVGERASRGDVHLREESRPY